MKEYKYVKVSAEVARQLKLYNIRRKTADGSVLLNQTDVMPLEGDTLQEKVLKAGGGLLTEREAYLEVRNVPAKEPKAIPEEDSSNSTTIKKKGDTNE